MSPWTIMEITNAISWILTLSFTSVASRHFCKHCIWQSNDTSAKPLSIKQDARSMHEQERAMFLPFYDHNFYYCHSHLNNTWYTNNIVNMPVNSGCGWEWDWWLVLQIGNNLIRLMNVLISSLLVIVKISNTFKTSY